jgi:AAA family ATP:ADP antiporter
VGAQTEGLLKQLGMGLAALATVAVPLAAAWMALGIWLGYAQRARARGIEQTEQTTGVTA